MSRPPDVPTMLLCHRIETLILMAEESAQPNLVLKDADIKSALTKAAALVEGNTLKSEPKDLREHAVFALARRLAKHSTTLLAENVSKTFYVQTLKFIAISLKARREMGGHPRGYLEFLADYFLKSGKSYPETLPEN